MKNADVKLRTLFIILSMMAVLFFMMGGYLYYSSLSRFSEAHSHEEAAEQLREMGNNIDGYLTWSLLSVKSLAGLKELKQFLLNGDAPALAETNTLLDHFQNVLKVSVCYLMDNSGNTIASSNRDAPDTFVGENYGFRPYFIQSMQGRPAVYMALGVTSKTRGVYYSHPVYDDKGQSLLGVVVIKAPINPFQKDLVKSWDGVVLLTDPHGVVFVSSRPEWLYHMLWPTPSNKLSEIANTHQFGAGPWNWTGVKLMDKENAVDDQGNKYRMHQQALANYPGWQLVYLHSHSEVMKKIVTPLRRSIGASVIIFCLFFGIIVLFLFMKANTSIVERTKAEAELKKRKDELKSIFRAAPTGIGVVCNRVIQQVNDRVCEITGYARNELIGQSARIFYPSDEEYEYLGREKYRQIKEQGSGTVETRFKHKNGKIIHVLMGSTPLDPADLSAGVTFTVLDITKRKHSEAALIEEKEFTETILNSQQDTFFLFEIASGRAIRWNRAFNLITGYTDEEIAGMLVPKAYCSPEDLSRAASFTEKVLKKGIGRIALDLICKDGRTIPTEYNISVVKDNDGNPKYFISIGRDMTERKQAEKEKERLEAQLQQALKMEAVGTLSGGIAHDFNNILGIIMGNTEMAFDDVPDGNPSRQNLEEIKIACLRAKEVVRQLLSFSRKTEHLRKPIQVNDIVTESMKLLRASIPSSIDIDLNIPEKSETILADATQIHQVLINLCTNAAHAMEEKGGVLKIDVTNRLVDKENVSDFGELTLGRVVQITVCDTGHGMPPEVREKMFDPYYTTKSIGKGTGMGLAVVHGIVKSHNGGISVHSEPGKGTTVRVLFPLIDASAVTEDPLPQALATGTEKILLIDDEIALVKMQSRILKRLGYQVKTQTDPEQALELFRQNPSGFDLVITDMTMPHLTGEQLAREIFKMTPNLPIILCTGYSEKISNKTTALASGIRRYIEKPLNMREFARTIREVLDGG